jgi:hypothetical protein
LLAAECVKEVRSKKEVRLNMSEKIRSVRELDVYKVAFKAAMEIFQLSKQFPVEERYSLTDQIRRSSRSIC